MGFDTVVIGGGIAGLSAGYFSKGKTLILEKSDFLGGRVYSVPVANNNFIELGAQFFSDEDPHIYSLVKQLKITDKLSPVSLNDFFVLKEDGSFAHLTNENYNGIDSNAKKELAKFFDTISNFDMSVLNNPPKELIDENFEKWYKSNIGENSYWLVYGMVRAITFSVPTEISAIYGLIVCSTFFGKCFTFKGGLISLINKLEKSQNSTISLNSEVSHCEFVDNNIKFIDYYKSGKDLRLNTKNSKVISALPANVAQSIFDCVDLKRKFSLVDYHGCYVKVYKFENRVLDYNAGVLISDPKIPVSVVINEPNYSNFSSKNGIIAILMPYKVDTKNSTKLSKKADDVLSFLGGSNNKGLISSSEFFWDQGLPIFNKNLFNLQKELKKFTVNSNFKISGDFMGLPSLDASVESAYYSAKDT